MQAMTEEKLVESKLTPVSSTKAADWNAKVGEDAQT